jgi:hypothetical protein
MRQLPATKQLRQTDRNEPHPGMIQSIKEQQEIPKEDAAVMPVGGPRKRSRICSLPVQHHQKIRERTRGKSGSMRKSAVCLQEGVLLCKSGEKGNSSGESGPRKTVDRQRVFPCRNKDDPV